MGEVDAVVPFPKVSAGGNVYEPEYHNCSAKHPCSGNGELFNATCGRFGNGTMDNLTEWRVVDLTTMTEGEDGVKKGGGGWGCTGLVVNGSVCVDGEMRFAMAYAQWDESGDDFLRTLSDLRLHKNWGEIQGGSCEVEDEEELNDGQPLWGGYCVCDSIRNGRFKHPSAKTRDGAGTSAPRPHHTPRVLSSPHPSLVFFSKASLVTNVFDLSLMNHDACTPLPLLNSLLNAKKRNE